MRPPVGSPYSYRKRSAQTLPILRGRRAGKSLFRLRRDDRFAGRVLRAVSVLRAVLRVGCLRRFEVSLLAVKPGRRGDTPYFRV